MGACCSCRTSTKRTLKTIRVVHLDGVLEVYESPTTVNQVISNLPKHFMSTPVQLIQNVLVPLKLDTQLEPGRIYFVLPFSILRFNEAPGDLINLAKKLTNVAKTHRPRPKPKPAPSTQISLGCSNGEKNNMRNSTKSLSWKPILATIREISFNRRESDLQSFNRRSEIDLQSFRRNESDLQD
ncbi:uncharacterized protein LOC112500941 [Cynara cardunculus var. scolymus]|uniref:DUF4228 domain-containing protein n=1 Tax=Cynara cardunculus var. scolymus TaxID=59895 RepID=A0A103Y2P1_CYNCS|nr:uncharacterized protein LOC112500941 [Cynara cardunculus var. scolymus]KVI01433.1 Protein of unknown function DUF4228 [Cynara cardunculus var. scolymus]